MGPTKEQTEVLATALRTIHPGPAPWPGPMTSDEMAAAILAALDDWTLASTRDHEDEAFFMQQEIDNQEAEIARLRTDPPA